MHDKALARSRFWAEETTSFWFESVIVIVPRIIKLIISYVYIFFTSHSGWFFAGGIYMIIMINLNILDVNWAQNIRVLAQQFWFRFLVQAWFPLHRLQYSLTFLSVVNYMVISWQNAGYSSFLMIKFQINIWVKLINILMETTKAGLRSSKLRILDLINRTFLRVMTQAKELVSFRCLRGQWTRVRRSMCLIQT